VGRLKEHVYINQAARDWVAANHPPTTPANETFFGFVFKTYHLFIVLFSPL